MTKTAKALGLIGIILATGIAAAQEAAKPMTLDECLVRAMENNLSLKVQVLNPELARLSVARASEKFLPTLSFQYNKQRNDQPSYSFITANDTVLTRYSDNGVKIDQLLPFGGSVSASLSNYKNDTNEKYQTINPRYGSQVLFSFTQPLFKDFGFSIARREFLVARNNRDIAENDFRRILTETLFNAESAYWDLVYNMENLKVRRRSLDLAKDLLAKNKREVEVGMMAPIEVLSAEAEVATREADILQAEVLVKNSEDLLSTLLNFKQDESGTPLTIAPADIPTPDVPETTVSEALAQAMANRPELRTARIDVKNRDLDLTWSRNQLLPDLSFQANYWSPGISGTQILYANNDPLTGAIIGTLPGRSRDALKDATNFRYKNWSIGLTLSLPLNTVFSRAQAAQAAISFHQAQIALEDREQQVFLEVRNAVREVGTNVKRVTAYEAARLLAEKKLEAETKKLKVGMTTNYLVLQYQRDLATAQSAELRARIDLVVSRAKLEKATGVGLDKKNIKVS
jgi:outer membrane protein TolC